MVAVCLGLAVTAPACAQNKAPQRPALPKGFIAEYDVAYVPMGDEAQRLDIYFPETRPEQPLPLLIWIHGGGWTGGSKTQMPYLSQLPRGYAAASLEYRFSQKAKFPAQIQDCQAAIRWLRANAAKYHLDPARFGVGGASAGGHLAALVGTDDRLLSRHGLEPGSLGGVVLLDGAGYDVPRQMAAARLPRMKELYRDAFGDDPEAQRDASPITHVAPGKRYPPFLIFHVGQRLDSRQQSEALAERLRTAGGEATTVHEPDKNHLTLNRELGTAGDGPTAKVLEFLDACRASRAASAGSDAPVR